jgi:hypothetical protein
MKTVLSLFLISCILSGCTGFVINKSILGNYYLTAPDVDKQLSLSYHENSDGGIYGTIIEETVFAVGINKGYIIAKQHPSNNRNITNYFILPIKKGFDWTTKNGLIGPLTINQFNDVRKDLRLGQTIYTIVYQNLE